MECPKCNRKAVVVDSRKKGAARRRRFECMSGHRFNSVEVPLLEDENMASVMNAFEAIRASQRRGLPHVRGTIKRARVSPKTAQVCSRRG